MIVDRDRIVELLVEIIERTQATPADIYDAMPSAWEAACLERERKGQREIEQRGLIRPGM